MFMAEEERKYAYFMCSTYTIGGVRAERLLARGGAPQAVYEAETEEWRKSVGNSAAEAKERQKKIYFADTLEEVTALLN